ncbi:hypothetical protein IE53DRAFT_377080 [Violaceomyces palustris]|uniref:Uncharacterized protein n=1 Tax=Violaceomyces palustris TaxID=1673888 RepID=A0ACD0P6P3_9BASI|nr:hypothetical protein IE53DRAFT_377080 [Violaceomyces palustris]
MMLFDQAHNDELKAWLTTELGPICDADPEVLSDYVLALLKHEASDSDLKKLLKEQLVDFLSAETEVFVEKTFLTLKTKSYLPSGAGPSANLASSVGEDTSPSRKRRADDDDARRSPPKQSKTLNGPASGPTASTIQALPSAPAADRRSGFASQNGQDKGEGGSERNRERDQRERENMSNLRNGPGIPLGPQPQRTQGQYRKGMCRDYHNNGYCSRGVNCKYEHSMDPIIGVGAGPFQGMGAPAPLPMGQIGPMIGQMRPPHMSQGPMMFPGPGFGLPPQGWASNMNLVPTQGMQMGVASPGGQINGFSGAQSPPVGEGASLASRLGGQVATPTQQGPTEAAAMAFPNQTATEHASPVAQGPLNANGSGRGGFNGRGRGRGGGPPGHFQSQRKSNTTLVIENVPADSLDLVKVNEYFKKFGTITNISIDVPGSKALVSFSQPAEAKSAHESPEVIFGNRFVKVYFQRLDEPLEKPAPSAPKPKPTPTPPPKSNFVPGQNVYHARPPTTLIASGVLTEERKKLLEDQKAKQAKLESQLAEQKSLLAKIGSKDISVEEKKTMMTTLKKLAEDIKASTEAMKTAVQAAAPSSALKETASVDSQKWKEEREKREREQLDRELDLHSKGASSGSTTEELKKKLESLKAEAASLGLDASGASGYSSRGRGRGYYSTRGTRGFNTYVRGRGAAPVNRSMRLDNRTTMLRVSELPEGANLEKAQDYFKQFGEIESISNPADNAFTVAFKLRSSGEQAMRKGNAIPEIGNVKLSWVESSSTPNAETPGDLSRPPTKNDTGEDDEEESDRDSSWKRG